MTKLNFKKSDSYRGKLVNVTVNDGNFGQEVVFEWTVQGHPSMDTFVKKFRIGDEKYGQKAFQQLEKVMQQLTGQNINDHADLQEEKIKGMVCDLTFGNYEGHDYIASIKPVGVNTGQFPVMTPQMPASVTRSNDFGDDIPF